MMRPIAFSLVFVVGQAGFAQADGFRVLHTLSGNDGSGIVGNLATDGSTIWGTTGIGGQESDGAYGSGTLFSINPDGSNFQLVHALNVGGIGADSSVTVVGTKLFVTVFGGTGSASMYSVDKNGSNYQDIPNQFQYVFGLTQVGSTLYGSGEDPDPHGDSFDYSLFSMNLDGSNLRILHAFTPQSADAPSGLFTQVGATLYGVNFGQNGMASEPPSIFSMNLDGSNLHALHTFNAVANNPFPQLPQLLSPQLTVVGSTLYGTSFGNTNSLFSMNLDGSNFQILHSFDNDGIEPTAGLTLVGSTLYGTGTGGSSALGKLFSINLDGSNFQILHSFTDAEGSNPTGLTLVGSTLFGATQYTGTDANGFDTGGTIFAYTIPEPSTLVLATLGGLALLAHRRPRSYSCGLVGARRTIRRT